MKRKIGAWLLVLVLCFGTTLPAFAADGFADEFYRVQDTARLLSPDEETALLERLDEISVRQSMDVVVMTTDGLDGYGVGAYAKRAFEDCNFGYGAEKDGVLLLISMEERDWYILTHGYGMTAFTNAGIQYIGGQMKNDLSDGNYAAAFETFAAMCDDFITQARAGAPYDRSTLPREPLSWIWVPISVGIGLVIALGVVGSMKGKLKSVRAQTAANGYVKTDSLRITESRDLFLYTTVTQTAKPKNEPDNDGSDSSGGDYGGGGGKF